LYYVVLEDDQAQEALDSLITEYETLAELVELIESGLQEFIDEGGIEASSSISSSSSSSGYSLLTLRYSNGEVVQYSNSEVVEYSE